MPRSPAEEGLRAVLSYLKPVLSYLPHFMLTSAETQQAINAL